MNIIICRKTHILKALMAMTLLLLFLTGCGTTTTTMLNYEPPLPVPATLVGNLKQVAVSDVISAIPMDTEIGHGHIGLMNFRNDTYLAGSKISEAHTLILTSIEEELSLAGYTFLVTKSQLFGAAKSKGENENILIGGEILDCKFDSYNSVGGKNSKAQATVEWSLYDPVTEKIIFRLETSGAATGPEKSVSSLAFSVRASFAEFINDPGFIDSLSLDASN